MCTYQTAEVELSGSGKGPGGLVPAFETPPSTSTTRRTIPAEHSLNIDFLNLDGPTPAESRRRARPGSARELATRDPRGPQGRRSTRTAGWSTLRDQSTA